MGFTRTLESVQGKKFEGGGRRAPLPAGKYVASVFDAERDEYKSGPGKNNGGRPLINIQFRIEDGQRGANSRHFQQVGLFPTWAPTEKNPDGSDNFTFFGAFAALRGDKNEKAIRAEVEEQFQAWLDEQAEAGKTEVDIFDFEPKILDANGEVMRASTLIGRKVILNLKTEFDSYAWKEAVKNGDVDEDDEEEKKKDHWKRNSIGSFKVYDGSDPAAGSANTESPKVKSVEL